MGSKADLVILTYEVRFTLDSGHPSDELRTARCTIAKLLPLRSIQTVIFPVSGIDVVEQHSNDVLPRMGYLQALPGPAKTSVQQLATSRNAGSLAFCLQR